MIEIMRVMPVVPGMKTPVATAAVRIGGLCSISPVPVLRDPASGEFRLGGITFHIPNPFGELIGTTVEFGHHRLDQQASRKIARWLARQERRRGDGTGGDGVRE